VLERLKREIARLEDRRLTVFLLTKIRSGLNEIKFSLSKVLSALIKLSLLKLRFSALASYINALVTLLLFVLLSILIPGLEVLRIIVFALFVAGIVGFSTYYYIAPPPWEVFKPISKSREQYIEALKLEHEALWAMITTFLTITTIVITVTLLWISAAPILASSGSQDPSIIRKAVDLAILKIAYLLLGLILGVLGALFSYTRRIRMMVAGAD
jgi:hypothetical protein